MPFQSNPALEAAVIADAHSDVPRLVYADWLDEHGDDVRAEFIRIQCRLHEVSPADEEWIDLTERQTELCEILQAGYVGFPDVPKELDEQTHFTASAYTGSEVARGRFERGFPYLVDHTTPLGRPGPPIPTPEEFAVFLKHLPKLVAATTLRALSVGNLPSGLLGDLLNHPAFQEFTGLTLGFSYLSRDDHEAVFDALASGTATRNLRQFRLHGGVPARSLKLLAQADALAGVRRLFLQGFGGTAADVRRLVAGPLFQRLRHYESNWLSFKESKPLLDGLAKLPHLHTLELPQGEHLARSGLTGRAFPALGRLIGSLAPDAHALGAYAKAKLPHLRVLDGSRGGMKNAEFAQLSRCPWFEQLLSLDVSSHQIGDKGVLALATHPVAVTIRRLYLGDNAFGKKGLLAFGTRFPNLTTLHLGSYLKRRATEADVAEFLAKVELPGLRALDLMNWPVGPSGAKALAANPAFASLSRLGLCDCKIGDAGVKVLLASPHLGNLRSLNLENNGVTKAAEGFLKAGALPGLRYLDLQDNKLPKAVRARFYATDLPFVVRLPRD
jgi:uncharacterized protein (TIGR02996 family)